MCLCISQMLQNPFLHARNLSVFLFIRDTWKFKMVKIYERNFMIRKIFSLSALFRILLDYFFPIYTGFTP